MQWLVNTSLLKVICRGDWLYKLTYPVIYRLTLSKSDLCQTSNNIKHYIETITFNHSNKDNHPWNDMITALMLTLHSSAQLKLNSDVNWTIKLSQKQKKGKCEAKRHKVMPTMHQTKSNRQNRALLAQRLWTENKLFKEHN